MQFLTHNQPLGDSSPSPQLSKFLFLQHISTELSRTPSQVDPLKVQYSRKSTSLKSVEPGNYNDIFDSSCRQGAQTKHTIMGLSQILKRTRTSNARKMHRILQLGSRHPNMGVVAKPAKNKGKSLQQFKRTEKKPIKPTQFQLDFVNYSKLTTRKNSKQPASNYLTPSIQAAVTLIHQRLQSLQIQHKSLPKDRQSSFFSSRGERRTKRPFSGGFPLKITNIQFVSTSPKKLRRRSLQK